jgi:hypothetical protein
MTEDEMKKTWCPFVRATNGKIQDDGTSEHRDGQTTYNRIVDGSKWAWPVGGCCIGSRCSAWRWGDAEDDPSGQRRDTWPDIAKYGPADQLVKRHGFCGLAGKP